MKTELFFKSITKSKWYCGMTLLFLFFANQTFGQTTRYVQADVGMDISDCTALPCATINYAIGQSDPGDSIEVGEGVYTESISIDIPLTINGESETETIIQAAELPGTATSRVVTIEEGFGKEINLSNITIRHGRLSGGEGGGLLNDGSILTLTNVTVSENEISGSGAGIFSIISDVHLTNVTFYANHNIGDHNLGGAFYNVEGSPVLNDVIFQENTAWGGAGMLNVGGTPILNNVIFENNTATLYGAGLSNQNNSSPILTNCLFIGNSAPRGAAILDLFNPDPDTQQIYRNVEFIDNFASERGGALCSEFSTPQLINAVFRNNSSVIGGAVYLEVVVSPTTFTNVTLHDNHATDSGGGLYVESISQGLTLKNAIIWGNSAVNQGNQILYNNITFPIDLSFGIYPDDPNDVVGDFVEENISNQNPEFVDSGNGDLRLMETSPAINMGDPSTDPDIFPEGPANPLDLDNQPRFSAGTIDLGAYEYQSISTCPAPEGFSLGTITSTTAEFSWEPVGGQTDGYNWFVMNLGETPGIDEPAASGNTPPWITFTTATGLTPGTMYFAFLQTNCLGGEQSDYAGPFMIMTSEGGGECEQPSEIIVSDVTGTSAEISWSPATGETDGYNWFVMNPDDIPGLDDPVSSGTTEPGITWATATGLTPATMYSVFLQTNCNAGEQSGYAGPIIAMTSEGGGECLPPSDITVSTVTNSVAFVSWTENGDATEWELEYGESGFTQGEGTIVMDNDGIPGETIGGLTQGVEYDVYVRAVCEFSESDWEGPTPFVIEPEPCSEPSDIIVDNVTPTMVYVNWTENGDAIEWEIEYGESGFTQGEGTIIIDNDGTPGEAISGLQAETGYDAYVRAICEFSESEWMGPTPFTTEEDLGTLENTIDNLVLYPNPTTGVINIQTEEPITQAEVYTISGRKLPIQLSETGNKIDISELSIGVYFVRITANNQSQTYKVIKE